MIQLTGVNNQLSSKVTYILLDSNNIVHSPEYNSLQYAIWLQTYTLPFCHVYAIVDSVKTIVKYKLIDLVH